jgi:hypothetical protein
LHYGQMIVVGGVLEAGVPGTGRHGPGRVT